MAGSTEGGRATAAGPILWFDDPAALERPRAGGKGASLARLVQWGLPVPPGFVVTADALSALLELAGVLAEARARAAAGDLAGGALDALADDLRERVTARDLPADLRDAILDAYHRLGQAGVSVAVRSSAAAEDSAQASFAGQQDTYLEVCGEAAVLDRVRACLASLFTPRALVYRTRKRAWDDLSLAVVVQAMVEPSKAGIMFTRDPVQGRDRVVVEAVRGSGDALASGEAVPDHYEVDRRGRTVVSSFVPPMSKEPIVSPAELQEIVEIGLKTESLFGSPQDIEWAIADRLYLLQSRPITTL